MGYLGSIGFVKDSDFWPSPSPPSAPVVELPVCNIAPVQLYGTSLETMLMSIAIISWVGLVFSWSACVLIFYVIYKLRRIAKALEVVVPERTSGVEPAKLQHDKGVRHSLLQMHEAQSVASAASEPVVDKEQSQKKRKNGKGTKVSTSDLPDVLEE